MRDAESVTFAGGSLDRASQLRSDAAAVTALAAHPRAGVLALSRGRPLVTGEAETGLVWLPAGHPLFAEPAPVIFLGLEDGAPRFAREIPDWPTLEGDDYAFSDREGENHPDLPGEFRFHELRSLMSRLDTADAGNAVAAKGILAWHQSHGFCARCGQPSEIADSGWKRICPACGAQHFPRTDPVVIMLITHGNSLLLGRSSAWPPGMYSLLAGFMEPGESIEAAVRRETWEETGIHVGQVDYLASQPWPFPASLMLGCHGEALSAEIRRDPNELEDARWLTREEAMMAAAGHNPDVRPARRGSIARFLIERWLSDTLD